jgi:hypothetical protein
LLKNREEGFTGKAMSSTKERKRGKYKSDEVESMDKVQMLGEAFQKIQAATGIHVPSLLSPCICAVLLCQPLQSPSMHIHVLCASNQWSSRGTYFSDP